MLVHDSPKRSLSFTEKLASSKAGAWYFINVTAKLDPWLLKQTDGRLSSLPGQPILLLKHTGAKTGKARETPLVYATDGDDIILIASFGGSPNHPAWYHNLRANPSCEIIAHNRSGHYLASELEGAGRTAMWEKALDVYGGYDVYQERAEQRTIPVLRLQKVQ